jgi:dTDP-4-amino-4,6-dideoxygalactose transaminase
MQAAMGLCNLKKFEDIVNSRRKVFGVYDASLPHESLRRPEMPENLEYNYSYYPVAFKDEMTCLRVLKGLNENNIFPRRYFYPSLNTLPYVDPVECPVSDSLSKRILCLPLYHDLEEEAVRRIASHITGALGSV